MITPHPHQRQAIDSLYNWFAANQEGNPLLVLPTGAGKSVVLAVMIREILQSWPDQRILVLTHVKELIEQNAKRLAAVWPEAPMGVHSAGLRRRDCFDPVIFAGIQSVHSKALHLGLFDLIFVDECFVAGTRIATPYGQVKIENIKKGDLVCNKEGIGVVEQTSIGPSFETYKVRLSNGKHFECTGNHPIYTERGWVKAKALELGSRLFSIEDMRVLRKGISSVDKSGKRKSNLFYAGVAVEQAKILFCKMRENICSNCFGQTGEIKDKRKIKSNKTQADQKGRKWSIIASPSTSTITRSRKRLGCGIFNQDACRTFKRSISKLLQGGHSKRKFENSNRNRWAESFSFGKKGARRQEARNDNEIRVVNISRIKRESAIPVYNLHVSGHPSYFANGIAAHNCHLISGKASSMYQTFFAASRQINPAVRIVGLTATDFRTGTGSLTHGENALFSGVAYQIDLLYLIEQGYLCPLVSRPVDTQIDVSGVQTRNGEFVAGQLESAADKDEITQAALSEAITLGADRHHWLVFCAGVAHAQHVTTALNERGIKSACVTGKTPPAERDNAIAGYRAGRLRALVTVGVLTTGFDAPETDLLVMLRPTQSPGLYVQISGRGMRTAPGKTDCMVLDFAGNALRHGPVDQVKAWIPKPKTGPTAAPFKVCPECESKVATSTRVCYCGYEFELSEKPKHGAHATTAPMLSTDIRVATVRVPVSRVIYNKHQPIGKMPSLRVDYYDGLMKSASEWVCLQHDGYARRKAVQWWVQRRTDPALSVPETIDEALDARPYDNLKRPSAIVVQQKKYPEIVGYEFE